MDVYASSFHVVDAEDVETASVEQDLAHRSSGRDCKPSGWAGRWLEAGL